MELGDAVAAYVAELLDAIDDPERATFGKVVAAQSDGAADSLERLQASITAIFMSQGWQPPDFGQTDGQGDGQGDGQADGHAGGHDIDLQTAPQRRAAVRAMGDHVRSEVARIKAEAERTREQLQAAQTEVEQLRVAMQSRATIEQAKGIVMAQYGLSAESAWNYLVRESQSNNVKLRAVAEDMVRNVTARPHSEQS